MLELPPDRVGFTVFDEFRAGLLKPESDIAFHGYVMQIYHPVEITRAGLIARLAANNHLFHPFPDMVGAQVYFSQQRFADEYLMPDRGRLVDRQAVVGAFLVLDRAADGDVFIAFAPVVGDTGR